MKFKKISRFTPVILAIAAPIVSLSYISNDGNSRTIGSVLGSASFKKTKASKGYRYIKGFQDTKYNIHEAYQDNLIIDGTNDLGNDFNGEVGSVHYYSNSRIGEALAKNVDIEFLGYAKEVTWSGIVNETIEFPIFSLYNRSIRKYFTIMLIGITGQLENVIFDFAQPKVGFITTVERDYFYDSMRWTLYYDLYRDVLTNKSRTRWVTNSKKMLSSSTTKNLNLNKITNSSFSFKSSWGKLNSVTRSFKYEYTLPQSVFTSYVTSSISSGYSYNGSLNYYITNLYALPSQTISGPHESSNVNIQKITVSNVNGINSTILPNKVVTKPGNHNLSSMTATNYDIFVRQNGVHIPMVNTNYLSTNQTYVRFTVEGTHYASAKSGSLVGSTTTATLNDIYLSMDINYEFNEIQYYSEYVATPYTNFSDLIKY